jgi:DUF1365 family protein
MYLLFLFLSGIFISGIFLFLYQSTNPQSAVGYTGIVSHYRFLPKPNEFHYTITMDYFDIDKPPTGILLYHDSSKYLLQHSTDFYLFFQKNNRTTYKETNKIMLLTNSKYFWSLFNPISVYFCYKDNELQYILSEVSNIPWFEKTHYLTEIDEKGEIETTKFDKKMHVSPFNPVVGQKYKFDYHKKEKEIFFSVSVYERDTLVLYAKIKLHEIPFQKIRGFQSMMIIYRIHKEAFFLWIKNFPLYNWIPKQNVSYTYTAEHLKRNAL